MLSVFWSTKKHLRDWRTRETILIEAILITDHSLLITQEKIQIQSDLDVIFIKITSNFMLYAKVK